MARLYVLRGEGTCCFVQPNAFGEAVQLGWRETEICQGFPPAPRRLDNERLLAGVMGRDPSVVHKKKNKTEANPKKARR